MRQEIPTSIQYLIGLLALASVGVGFWTGVSDFPWFKIDKSSPLTALAIDPFAKIKLEAKSVFVYEPDTGRIFYARDEDRILPIASVTKIMTALTASEILSAGTIIPFSSRRHYQVRNLIALTLISSSNEGALALASSARETFSRDLVAEMNTEAASLGLTRTSFTNPTGLDLDDKQAGSYSSARDIAQLVAQVLALDPELLNATKFTEIETATIEGIRHRFENTNEIVSELPGLIASKTGFTDIAEGSLVIAFDRGLNQPVVVVVLGSSKAGRFSDVKQLVEATLEATLLSS